MSVEKPKVTFRLRKEQIKGDIYNNHEVYRDDEHLGELYHLYPRPGMELDRHHRWLLYPRPGVKLDRHQNHPPLRRAWRTCHYINKALGINPYDGIYPRFPLYEAKALVSHCLENGITLENMEISQINVLAKHCRSMELAGKQRNHPRR